MNILYATDVFEGSPIIHTFEICKHLTEIGDKIDLVINLPEEKLQQFKTLKNMKIYNVVDAPIPRSFRVSILKPVIQDFPLVLKSMKVKKIDLIYTRNALLALQLKLFNPRTPVVWEVNGLSSVEFQVGGEKHPIKVWLAKTFEEKLLPIFLDKIIAVVPAIKETMIKSGANGNKIEVVLNGADHVKFSPDTNGAFIREKYNIEEDTKLIIFTGTIRPWHGMDHILNIFSKVIKKNQNVKLLIVGTGKKELLRHYKQLACDLGLNKNLIFAGWINNEDMPKYIAAADVGIHTAIYHHDLNPFKVLEYMASGKPVIGSIYGLRELLEKSKGGVLIDPLKYEESAEKIIELLSDQSKMKDMGNNARSYIVEHHDWRKNMKRLHDILETMV